MSYIPMHNRFAEGFVEPESSGEALDPLSSQIRSAPLAAADFDEVLRRALSARDAALAAALVRAGRSASARGGNADGMPPSSMPPTSTRWPILACAGATFAAKAFSSGP